MYYTLWVLSTAVDGCECIRFFACAHVCPSWVVSVMDDARWQPDAKQTPTAVPHPAPPPTMYDGHNRWTQTYKNTRSHTQSWFIHNVLLTWSLGSSKDAADVTGLGLCTSYVRDSCEWRGLCQQSHRLLSKTERQAESIPQHQQARFIWNRSRVCARNGWEVKKQHLWSWMDARLTPGSSPLSIGFSTFQPYILLQ